MFRRKRPLPDLRAVPLDAPAVGAAVDVLEEAAALWSQAGETHVFAFLEDVDEQVLAAAVGLVLRLRAELCRPQVAAQLPVGPWRGPTVPWAPQRVALLPELVLAGGGDQVRDVLATPVRAVTVPDVDLEQVLAVSETCESVLVALAGRYDKQAEDVVEVALASGWVPLDASRWPELGPDWDERSWALDLQHAPVDLVDWSDKQGQRFQTAHPDCSYTARYPSLAVTGFGGSLQSKHLAADVHRSFWLGHVSTVLLRLLSRLGADLTGTDPDTWTLRSPLPQQWTTRPYRRIAVERAVQGGLGGLTGGKQALPAPHEPVEAALDDVEVEVDRDRRTVRIVLPVPGRAPGTLEDLVLAHSRLLAAALLRDLDDLTPQARSVLGAWTLGQGAGQRLLPELVDDVVRLADVQGIAWVDAPPDSVLLPAAGA